MKASAFRLITAGAVLAMATATFFAQAPRRVTVIAYGDTRFTDPSNFTATNPRARAALVDRIDTEHPDALLVSGDLPWHGNIDDYVRFTAETEVWRRHQLRVLPALGNHEFSGCDVEVCLERWWSRFPELRGRRWYSKSVASNVVVFALDTMSPLTAGAQQRAWLEGEIAHLSRDVQFVLITLHHPPVADVQTRLRVDHNPRPNEIALAEFLKSAAQSSHARFVVIAGHIHNYERFLQDDIVYLVSGGGGAVPYEVERTPIDLYKGIDFPNYHYVKMTIAGGKLTGEMYRLDEATAPMPHFTVKDTFELDARGTQLEGTH